MSRFAVTTLDTTDPTVNIDTYADDPGELLRKVQDKVMESFGSDLTASRNLTITVLDTRDTDHALMVKAQSAENLLQESDIAIRNTYRSEMQP